MPAQKTIKSAPDSNAGIVTSSNTARMHGNKDNYVQCDEKGVTINGPISFPAGPEQIRFGSLWTMNNPILLSLPSTLATPNAVLNINSPVASFQSLAKDVAVMTSLLTQVGG